MSFKDPENPQHVDLRVHSITAEKEKHGGKVNAAARDLAIDEKAMTTMQAVRANPAAICWSLVISTCVIMEGFDTALLGNFWAYPSFQRKFGDFVGVTNTTKSGYQVPASWQTGLGQASGVGAFFGAIFNGWLVNRFGPRMVLIASLCSLSAFLFITFFVPDRPTLLVGQLLFYASEVLPLQLRVYMTSYTNMCWIIGQLIAGGVLRGPVSREDSWGYRIPFALQWFWPIFLVPAIYTAPKSPWFLSSSSRQDPHNTLAAIIYTNNLEQQLSIACLVFAGQLQKYSLGVSANGLALFACLCNWFLPMPYVGRQTLFLIGILNVWTSKPSVAVGSIGKALQSLQRRTVRKESNLYESKKFAKYFNLKHGPPYWL
ncbi:MFS general substrate transporter [Cadophora sp. DSE1049]|nr:MFS general substrate transporter [Cadophora sp. DSE1049]